MKKFNFGFLGIIGILVLVVFASGCTSSNNNTTSNNSNAQGQANGQAASSTGTPIVKVNYNGPWTRTINDASGSRSVQDLH